MRHSEAEQQRRRSRAARQGLVAGAVAGSLGLAGALGLAAHLTQGLAASPDTTSVTPSIQEPPDDGLAPAGRSETDEDGEEADEGRIWIPAPPSSRFDGGQTATSPVAPHATSGGS